MSDSGWEGGERARRRPPLRLVAALVVVLAVALVVRQGRGEPSRLVVEESTEPPVIVAYEPVGAPPQLNGAWGRIAPGPLAGRAGASATWTGDDVLVWGGVGLRAYDDGALYDVAEDRWRVAGGGPSPRYGHAAVWDGDEVVVAGGRAVAGGERPQPGARLRDAAAYNPATDRWRRLPSLPFVSGAHRLFASGGRLYAISQRAQPRPVAVLDAGSSMWRLLPAVDWSADGDGIAGAVHDGALLLWPAGRGDAVALDLSTLQWSTVPHAGSATPLRDCPCGLLGGAMATGSTDIVAYDTQNQRWWRHDVSPVRPSYAGGPAGLLYLVQTAMTRVVERDTGTTLSTPSPPESLGFQPAAVWAGDRLFLWGGVSGVRRRFDVDGLTFTPGGPLGQSRIKVL